MKGFGSSGGENPSRIRESQRFGGSLNLNVHYHVAVSDGVFSLDAEAKRAEFHRLARPTQSDIEAVAFNVDMRVCAWLRRKQLLVEDEDHFRNQRTAIDACLKVRSQGRTFFRL